MGTYRLFRNNQKGATMKIEKKIQSILEDLVNKYTIPTYSEDYVKKGIKEALLIIKRKETHSRIA